MIHIIGLRKGTENPQKIFGIMGESIEGLFANIESVVAKIPIEERFNCYYTIFHPKTLEDPRSFKSQDVIPIDVDHVPDEQLSKVVEAVSETIKIPINKMIVVYSGHGVQFLIKSPFQITESKYFTDYRSYYKNMASHIQTNLKNKNLCGDVDTAVWSASRLMRLPLTINRKEGLPDVKSRLINATLEDTGFDLTLFKPEVEDIRRITVRTNVQKEGVLQCPFLKWCYENQLDVSEPQWHAMIGILAWIPEVGLDLCHMYSNQHLKYKPSEVESYANRSLKLTGPRTCNSISGCWGGCQSCEFRNDLSITTPLTLKTDEYITSQDTGFHFVIQKEGKEDKFEPDFEGLVKYLKQKYNYIVDSHTKIIYIWKEEDFTAFGRKFDGGYWHALGDMHIEAFADENFKPFVKDRARKEFLNLTRIRNLVNTEFFYNVEGFLNFKNGILNTRTGELFPHDKSYGFTYKLDFNYDPNAKSPSFDKFMSEITDEESARVLVEFIAIAAAGEPNSRFEKALVLSGTGANGKSVFMNTMRYLIGDKNCSSTTIRDMITPEGRYQTFNKLLNIVAEENKRSLLNNTDIFKAMVSGEVMSAKILYQNTFMFKPNAKFVYSFNELPTTDDFTRGFYRRFLIVDFPHSFEGREDRNLIHKLREEASGIWNRIIEAYLRVKKNNSFSESATINSQNEEFKEYSDTVSMFLEEYVVPTMSANDIIIVKDLYELYHIESKKLGMHPLGYLSFCKRLRDIKTRGIFRRMRLENGTKSTVLHNCKMKLGGSF